MINYFNSKQNNLRITSLLIVLLLILLPIQCGEPACPELCSQCFLTTYSSTANIFTCSTCKKQTSEGSTIQPYIWSCRTQTQSTKYKPTFIALCVIVVCLDLFMLSMGFGMYQIIYQLIQIVAIVVWVQVDDGGVAILQGTGFGVQRGNSFIKSYGIQFIIILFILSVFMFLVVASQRIPHNPTAILIRRKRIIFPTRVGFLCFNMLLFTSIVSINSIRQLSQIDIFELFLSILGVISAVALYFGVFYLCNFKEFKLDDINYYVVTQNMLSTRWWVKNRLFIQATNYVCIILAFVLGFSAPLFSIIIIFVCQALFTIYILVFLKYTKIRYKIFILLSCLIFLSIFICLYLIAQSIIYKKNYPNQIQTIYIILVISMCSIFIIAVLVQIIAQRFRIGRQLRSFKNRFILCEQLEKEVSTSKYDSNGGHRKRVTQWQDNVVYGCDLTGVREKFGVACELTCRGIQN